MPSSAQESRPETEKGGEITVGPTPCGDRRTDSPFVRTAGSHIHNFAGIAALLPISSGAVSPVARRMRPVMFANVKVVIVLRRVYCHFQKSLDQIWLR